MASSFLRFLDHTQRRTIVGRPPLDEWSARRRDLYLTIHNTHNRQIFMPPVEFEPTMSRRAAADLRLRPRGYWDRPINTLQDPIFIKYVQLNKETELQRLKSGYRQIRKYLRPPLVNTCTCALETQRTMIHFFCGAATQRGSWPPHSWCF